MSGRLQVAVIGGGITGLAAAHRIIELRDQHSGGTELTLFEAGHRVGGVAGTERIDGFLVESGADSFITNKPWAVDLCERIDFGDRLISTNDEFRRSLVLNRGRVASVPEGFMLLAPSQVWPVLRSPIFSLRGKLRMLSEYFRPRGPECDDESLASFVRRRFGHEALDRLVQPLVGGIYTSDPEQLSLRATMPRFPEMERKHGSVIRGVLKPGARTHSASGARYGLFATLRDGVSELVDELRRRIEQAGAIVLNTRIATLDRASDPNDGPTERWKITDAGGRSWSFDRVLVCLPSFAAAPLIGRLDSEIAALLQSIDYASSAVVATGHALEDIAHPLDAFGLVIPEIERRNILAVSFSSRKFPGRAPDGHVLLRTFLGGAMHQDVLEGDDEQLVATTRAELSDLLGVRGSPAFARVFRYDRAMPQYHVGHVDRVTQIEQRMQSLAGLELAGNAYRGVGLPDCIHSGEEAAERALR